MREENVQKQYGRENRAVAIELSNLRIAFLSEKDFGWTYDNSSFY